MQFPRIALRMIIVAHLLAACGKEGPARPRPEAERPARIELTPAVISLPEGGTAALELRAWNEDETPHTDDLSVRWSSEDESVATVSDDGLVVGVVPGETTIAATVGALQATADVKVTPLPIATLRIEPEEATIRAGETQDFVVKARDASDRPAEPSIEWQISDATVATLDVEGREARAEGKKKGIVTITAAADGIEALAQLRVLPAPARIEADVPTLLLLGEVVELEGAVFDEEGEVVPEEEVSWSTGTPEIIDLDPEGRMEPLQEGKAEVRAHAGALERAFEVVVEPRRVERLEVAFPDRLTFGEQVVLEAQAFDQRDETLSTVGAAWSSSAPGVLSVSDEGLLRAESRGEAIITARLGEAEVSGRVEVWVPVGAIVIEPAVDELFLAEVVEFRARLMGTDGLELSDRDVEWSASNARLAIDDEGRARALLPGEVTVRATAEAVQTEVELDLVELDYVEMRAGGSFLCGLTGAGEVYCMGDVPGTGARIDRPTLVPSPAPLVRLALGNRHGCGLDASGAAHCFGANQFGESGREDLSASASFLPVETDLRFQSLRAGASITCGITDASSGENTHCWGANAFGQLGDGSTEDRSQPTPIAGHRFVDLALSQVEGDEGTTSCGIDESHQVRCWGANDAGQMGRGDTTPALSPVPAGPPGPIGHLAVAGEAAPSPHGSFGHGCALSSAEQLTCWGTNGSGELGDGSQSSSLSPKPVPGDWSAVWTIRALGTGTSCALDPAGAAHCWGSNGRDQIGASGWVGAFVTDPTPVAGGHPFRELDMSSSSVCGITLGGRAFCWGRLWSQSTATTPSLVLGQRP